jgi:hypothetical protein
MHNHEKIRLSPSADYGIVKAEDIAAGIILVKKVAL